MGRQMPGEKYNCVFMYILEFEKVRRFYIFLNTDCFCKHLEKRNFIDSIRQNFFDFFSPYILEKIACYMKCKTLSVFY